MSFSRTDEVDLLTVLHEGPHEEPRWATFLARMQRRTRADHVSLIVGPADVSIHHATQWFAGRDMRAQAQQLHDLASLDPIPYHQLRPGRVYSATELIDPANAGHSRFRREYLEQMGVRHGRFMRVTDRYGRSGWLSVTRAADDFTAADSALLSSLAPHLSIALRTLGALEQAHLHLSLTDDALARAGVGWTALDRDGTTIEARNAPPVASVTGARLVRGTVGSREVSAIRVEGTPPVDLIAVSVAAHPLAAVTPAAVALTRRPPPLGPRAAAALEQLFGLAPAEARLAIRLAAGDCLADAAVALGLTIETTRNYSKRVFAKTGTRSQADLVRLVLTNVAILA